MAMSIPSFCPALAKHAKKKHVGMENGWACLGVLGLLCEINRCNSNYPQSLRNTPFYKPCLATLITSGSM